jgi:hypothetical protein
VAAAAALLETSVAMGWRAEKLTTTDMLMKEGVFTAGWRGEGKRYLPEVTEDVVEVSEGEYRREFKH